MSNRLDSLNKMLISEDLDDISKLKVQKAMKALESFEKPHHNTAKIKEDIRKTSLSRGLDTLQDSLTALGLTPALGIAPDIANTVISAARGDFVNMGVNAAAAIPVVGQGVGGAKLVNRAAKATSAVNLIDK